jgi:hypothetical protein
MTHDRTVRYTRGTTSARRCSADGSVRLFTRPTRTVLLLFTAVGCVFATILVAEFFAGFTVLSRLWVGIVAAGCTWPAVRIIRLAIIVEPELVVVRNIWRTHRIPVLTALFVVGLVIDPGLE